MTGGQTGTTQPCAACKYQRRKCAHDCPLAPYFPADHSKQFLCVHKLFGVSNVLRVLRQVDPSLKGDAVKSMVYEGEVREKSPVHGCLGIIKALERQVTSLNQELLHARSGIFLLERQQHDEQPAQERHQFSSYSMLMEAAHANAVTQTTTPFMIAGHTGKEVLPKWGSYGEEGRRVYMCDTIIEDYAHDRVDESAYDGQHVKARGDTNNYPSLEN